MVPSGRRTLPRLRRGSMAARRTTRRDPRLREGGQTGGPIVGPVRSGGGLAHEPVERVVGDFFPAPLPDDEVGAAGEFIEVGD